MLRKTIMKNGLQIDEFVDKALKFKLKLGEVATFNEIRNLWLETSIPYVMDNLPPDSKEYMDIQLSTYKKLTGGNYNVSNELTSTKIPDNDVFELGYPWSSKNLNVVGSELAKVSQALVTIGSLDLQKDVLEIVEFGAGWGNLAIPLAKSGHKVTCVDFDNGFLERITRIASKEKSEISVIRGDFVEVAESINSSNYDCVVFQSSFHHCLNFNELLRAIKKNVLNKNGVICFFAEPIFKNYSFPWGLRYDGESLWAITCNSWLELGFDYDFFSTLLLTNGFFMSRVSGKGTLIGDGYVAFQCENGISLQDWAMPSEYQKTWHIHNQPDVASFSKAKSLLPGLAATNLVNKRYKLQIQNYAPHELNIKVNAGKELYKIKLASGGSEILEVFADCEEVSFETPVFVPAELIGNGDTRRLGFAVTSIFAD